MQWPRLDVSKPGSVALLGPPGAGKTTLGRLLAQRRRTRFVDVDAALQDRLASLGQLVDRVHDGAKVRTVERDVALSLIRAKPGVLALGGGTWLIEDVSSVLLRAFTCVWISAPVSVLAARVRKPHGRATGAVRPCSPSL